MIRNFLMVFFIIYFWGSPGASALRPIMLDQGLTQAHLVVNTWFRTALIKPSHRAYQRIRYQVAFGGGEKDAMLVELPVTSTPFA